MNRRFPMTREAGLDRLARFAGRMGRVYADDRNTDSGPDGDATTSVLSPYLRRRLITEQEVVVAAIEGHGSAAAERFIQEVFWRTYFKGHLETRPEIWTEYRRLVVEGQDRLVTEPGLRRAYDRAVEGRAGIEGFDDWAREIVETNWLHNHSRMWFASIWIFTLRLPWALGADFFMRHLIDGDPASNTLSWRWVGGLHTRGKHYLARRENIRRFTQGRFDPAGLEEDAEALEEPEPATAVTLAPPDDPPQGEVALLLHLDDLNPESFPIGGARVTRVGGLIAHADGAANRVRQADRDAMSDGLGRAALYFGCTAELVEGDWAGGLPVITPWAPVGPSAAALPRCIRIRRDWDDRIWPRATRGFFQVKSAIPRILAEMDLRSSANE